MNQRKSSRWYAGIAVVALLAVVLTFGVITLMRGEYIPLGTLTGIGASSAAALFLYSMLTWGMLLWRPGGVGTGGVLLTLLLAGVVAMLPFALPCWESTKGSFLDVIMSTVGIIGGLVIWRLPQVWKIVSVALLWWLSIYVGTTVTACWLQMCGWPI